MTEMKIPARRDIPASWVHIYKEHLLGEVVQERAPLRGRRHPVLAPESPSRRTRRRRTGHGRVRLFALAAAVVVAALLSIPALGVGPKIVSLFAGMRDPDAAVPTASDVLIASGQAGVAWKILATRSDQGLCLDLFHRAGGDRFGGAGCGYIDIRGDLPPDIRGDPASKCIPARPTRGLVPCGSLPQHWIGPLSGGGTTVGLDHTFAFGPLAEDVASVELILTDGQTVRAHVVEQPGDLSLNFYWAAWPCPLQPVLDYPPYAGEALCAEDAGAEVKMAIALDAEGRVLERRVPAWNGNPTGDPDGPPPPTQGS